MASQEVALAEDSTAAAQDFAAGQEANLKVLDTPRTREACKKLGCVVEDLHFRPEKEFYIPGDQKSLQRIRFEHYEKRRKERLAHVLAERAKVIAANAKRGEVPGVQSGQFLSMLENLFEKEAKRLETDLKGRLRQHGALVKENEDQLQKEQRLQEKMTLDYQKREAAALQLNEISKQVGEKIRMRQEKCKELSIKVNGTVDDNLTKARDEKLAEEERMRIFKDEQKQRNADTAAEWKRHHTLVAERAKEQLKEKELQSEIKEEELRMRLQESDLRRGSLTQGTLEKCEERHMHLMDVREQKSAIDRVDGYRREELKEQAESKIERIETLLAVKDQLLDQRKCRNQKTEASKGSRGLNLRRDCLPGPGQYEAPRSTLLAEAKGIAIGKSEEPSQLVKMERVAKTIPPPGTYDCDVLPNGDRVGKSGPSGVAFGNRNRDSYLDDAIRAKREIPAPGRYDSGKSMLDTRATKMRRERITDFGLDKFSAKRVPVWARPATDTPGPAGYSVDEYTRKEVLRRAQSSLPNLTRDMLRPARAASAH